MGACVCVCVLVCACVCVPVCMHACAGMLMCECACRLCMDTLYMQKMVEGKTVVGSSFSLANTYVCTRS